MNEMQKDFFIGLLFRKIDSLIDNEINNLNDNNEHYIDNIKFFVELYGKSEQHIQEIYDFMTGDQDEFANEEIQIAKDDKIVNVNLIDRGFLLPLEVFDLILLSIKSYMQEYLPLGSVVTLNKEKLGIEDDVLTKLTVVIEQRMIRPKGKNYYIDYRAIPYPTGIFNDKMYVYFSSDIIEEVVFKGFADEDNEGYEVALKESLIDNNIFSLTYCEEDVVLDFVDDNSENV